jgi:hypothetical protein
MKGFIAYRGTIGKKLADQMQRWPTAVLPSVEPFFAPWHTAKGSRWRVFTRTSSTGGREARGRQPVPPITEPPAAPRRCGC